MNRREFIGGAIATPLAFSLPAIEMPIKYWPGDVRLIAGSWRLFDGRGWYKIEEIASLTRELGIDFIIILSII